VKPKHSAKPHSFTLLLPRRRRRQEKKRKERRGCFGFPLIAPDRLRVSGPSISSQPIHVEPKRFLTVFPLPDGAGSAGKETPQCCSVPRRELRRDRGIKHVAGPRQSNSHWTCVCVCVCGCVGFGQYPQRCSLACVLRQRRTF